MNNLAGIDVSKGKSIVSVLRPFGEVVALPFAVHHTSSELSELANYLKSLDGETRVVMEQPGGITNRSHRPSMTPAFMSVWSIPS